VTAMIHPLFALTRVGVSTEQCGHHLLSVNWQHWKDIQYWFSTAIEQYKHSLTFRVRRCVVIATKPVDRLQIRPIVHN